MEKNRVLDYRDRITEICKNISPTLVDLNISRKRGNAPTQAFSDFLTHVEQGDWAENLVFDALGQAPILYKAVRYGQAGRIIAGDAGFKKFYVQYQDELDSIGKRPDTLLFRNEDFNPKWKTDFESLSPKELSTIVPRAVAGFEIRSSAYLAKEFIPKKDRPFLSFTPKVEDLLVVKKWIETYNVPHYYIQVFFDSIYIIPFEKILTLLRDCSVSMKGKKNKKILGALEDEEAFVIEKNPKNQYKETIHIYLNQGELLAQSIVEPTLIANRKKLAGGRLLHYVSFRGGQTSLDLKALQALGILETG